jgi:hypothetical protein
VLTLLPTPGLIKFSESQVQARKDIKEKDSKKIKPILQN